MPTKTSLILDLERAIAAGTPQTRLDALTRITDLFLAGTHQHPDELIGLFDDVFLALVNTIEVNAKAQLSRRLACEPKAPPKTVRTLAFDNSIAVAAPVLMRSERLTEQDLVENIRTKSQNHLYAITQRSELSEPVTDALIDRGDARVIQLVVKNAGARISEAGFEKLVGKAASDQGLVRFVGARRDIPRAQFLVLLEMASSDVRARLIADNPALIDVVQSTVSDIVDDINVDVRDSSREHARAKNRVKRLCRTGQFSEADLHGFAVAQDFERTAVALATLGDFPIEIVERALVDKNPDTVLILAKAANCCRSTVRAILLMRTANRRMSAMDLEDALTHFARLQVNTARRTLEFYRLRRQGDLHTHAPSHLAMAWFAESIPEQKERATG